jgi:predicted permease
MLTGTRAIGSRKDWLRQILAASQIAISLVLLVGSGLLIRSLWRIQQIDLGVQTDRVLVVELRPGRGRKLTPDAKRAYYLEAEQRLKQVPGVELVALSDVMPPGAAMQVVFSLIGVEGRPADTRRGSGGMVSRQSVTETYFETLHIPILRGRGFLTEDRKSATELAIIDEALARRLFPGEEALGQRIRPMEGDTWATVVGVARNVRNMGLFDASDPAIYILQRDPAEWENSLLALIRTQRDERAVAPLIRSEIQKLDPKSPVTINALDTKVRELSAGQRFNAMLLGLFSFFALSLAAIGLAGVVSYLVTQRTQELGVRMALGATPRGILGLVLGQSLRWILAGAFAGLTAGLIGTRWLKSLLYQVEPTDPLIIGGVTLTLLAVGVVSAWLPARRAAKLDPMVALRHE